MFSAQLAWGQVSTGTVSGVEKDGSGAVIPGATVKVMNLETGISRTLSTDDPGRYSAPNWSLGDDEVKAEVSGFPARWSLLSLRAAPMSFTEVFSNSIERK